MSHGLSFNRGPLIVIASLSGIFIPILLSFQVQTLIFLAALGLGVLLTVSDLKHQFRDEFHLANAKLKHWVENLVLDDILCNAADLYACATGMLFGTLGLYALPLEENHRLIMMQPFLPYGETSREILLLPGGWLRLLPDSLRCTFRSKDEESNENALIDRERRNISHSILRGCLVNGAEEDTMEMVSSHVGAEQEISSHDLTWMDNSDTSDDSSKNTEQHDNGPAVHSDDHVVSSHLSTPIISVPNNSPVDTLMSVFMDIAKKHAKTALFNADSTSIRLARTAASLALIAQLRRSQTARNIVRTGAHCTGIISLVSAIIGTGIMLNAKESLTESAGRKNYLISSQNSLGLMRMKHTVSKHFRKSGKVMLMMILLCIGRSRFRSLLKIRG